jgi:hypothetical protein
MGSVEYTSGLARGAMSQPLTGRGVATNLPGRGEKPPIRYPSFLTILKCAPRPW